MGVCVRTRVRVCVHAEFNLENFTWEGGEGGVSPQMDLKCILLSVLVCACVCVCGWLPGNRISVSKYLVTRRMVVPGRWSNGSRRQQNTK